MKPLRYSGRHGRGERGQALVEFAIALLGVLLALLGTIEMGRFLLTYDSLAEAARVGVRYAVVHGSTRKDCNGCSSADGPSGPGDTGDVASVVQAAALAAGLSSALLNVSVTYPQGSNTVNETVEVTATYTYQPMAGIIRLSGVPLSSTSEGTISY